MNDNLLLKSDPYIVQENLNKYLNNDALLYFSDRKNMKYMILHPITNKWVHFGDLKIIDWTRHKNEQIRQLYLKRTAHVKSDWAKDKYSPNNLSRVLLHNG